MTAYTLFDIVYRTARELGVIHEGTATSGTSTTQTEDTEGLLDRFRDNYFNGGTIFYISDVSPFSLPTAVGTWARVTDFEESTGIVTHTAFGQVIGTGDRYAICNEEYALDALIMNINSILSEMEIPTVDITTVETDSDKTEYPLPTAMLDPNIKVWIQRSTTTDHNLWIEFHDWYIAPTATGTAKKLIFRTMPPDAWDIKLEYWLPHPALYSATDKLAESLDINRVVAEAALKCLLWKKSQKAQDDGVLDPRLAELMARVAIFRSRYPNKKPEIKLATYGNTDNFGGY
jgi:hypothetical protein